jgi:ABC-2 type transport system permease protein
MSTVHTSPTRMTTATPGDVTGPQAAVGVPRLPGGPGGPVVTLRRVLAAEWTKLHSLRSTAWLLVVTALLVVTVGVASAVGAMVGALPTDPATVDPLGGALTGISTVELLVAALGALAVTGEYTSGSVRLTLAAVPTRWPVLAAKAAVVAATVFMVVLAATVTAFLTASAMIATTGTSLSITAPGVARALVGAAVHLAFVGLLAVGLGWLTRSAVGTLAAVIGLLYVLPVVGFVLPADVAAVVVPFLPGNAGSALMQLQASGLLRPGAAAVVLVAWALLVLGAAAVVLRRRDA